MSAPWYETFFDKRYLDFYPVLRKKPIAAEEAEFVQRVMALSEGDRVLDLGCGTGRHSVALAQQGMKVTGLDFSAALLDQVYLSRKAT